MFPDDKDTVILLHLTMLIFVKPAPSNSHDQVGHRAA